jgi:branched-chain amino acid transport system ATP-binding protein
VSAALETRGLVRRFGHLTAVDGVDLGVETGTVHALIGPNGAGKTTVVNMLAGALVPSAGRILLNGEDVTGAAPNRLCRLGVGRTFQRSRVLGRAAVRENALLGAAGPGMGLLASLRPFAADVERRADAALERCGLAAVTDRPADSLSHGERRALEIAMTLAGDPSVLLLDEPLAGTGPDEGRALSDLIRSLGGSHTVVLVEHDMDAVFRIADAVTVLVAGRVLAVGAPAAIRADAAVQEAYLGHGDGAEAAP